MNNDGVGEFDNHIELIARDMREVLVKLDKSLE